VFLGKEQTMTVSEEPKKVTDPRWGVTFVEGYQYFDGAGDYVVQNVNLFADKPPELTVRYLNGRFEGESRAYPVVLKANHFYYMQRKRDAENRMKTVKINFTGDEESWVLGYLASRCHIKAEIPRDQSDWFEEMYKRLTGENAAEQPTGTYYKAKPESKYTLELRLEFPTPDVGFVPFFKCFGLEVLETATGMQINSNDLIKTLFRLGFRLGHNGSRVQEIRDSIPELDVEAFNKGVEG
jgi:hypothetical protein